MPPPLTLIPRTSFTWRERSDGAAVLTLEARSAHALVFEAEHDRLRVALALARPSRSINISLQPGLAWALIDEAASEQSLPGSQLRARVREALRDFAIRRRLWVPADPAVDGPALTMGMCFPFAGLAIDRGARAVQEVPRWAVEILAQRTGRAAAGHAFGRNASRRVVRALAASLVPPDDPHRPLALFPLALGLMASAVLDADRLAAVLSAVRPYRSADDWPDVELLRLGQAVLARLGASRAARVLNDAAELPSGPQVLYETLRMFRAVESQLPSRLPMRLPSLHELCRSQMAIDPRGAETRCAPPLSVADDEPVDQRVRRVFGLPDPPPPVRVPAQPLAAPLANRPTDLRTPISYPSAVRAVDRLALRGGELRLVLPRTVGEIVEWGRRLRNCLGDYPAAAVSGQSVLLGVERSDRLVYCLELTSEGAIRQFLGPANRAVRSADAAVVVQALVQHRVVDSSLASNSPWLCLAAAGPAVSQPALGV